MIQLNQVSHAYGERRLFENLDLTFEFGKSYAIVGQSGSGKSTLLNLLARLTRPNQGLVSFRGKDIWRIKERDYFKNTLGYIFQNYALVDNETIGENLALVESSKLKQSQALELVGLSGLDLREKIYSLSGGQGQRVAIARLLLKSANVILADEPTGALDNQTGQEVRDLLLSLVDEQHVVIFATHDPLIFEFVDEVIDIETLTAKSI